MSQEELRKYISYKDVLEWQEDLEFTHRVVVAWTITLARKRGTGQIVQNVTAIARRRQDKGFSFITQAWKAFGQGSDHATLPGAMIACIHELDSKLQEIEGPRLEDDTSAGRNPYV